MHKAHTFAFFEGLAFSEAGVFEDEFVGAAQGKVGIAEGVRVLLNLRIIILLMRHLIKLLNNFLVLSPLNRLFHVA